VRCGKNPNAPKHAEFPESPPATGCGKKGKAEWVAGKVRFSEQKETESRFFFVTEPLRRVGEKAGHRASGPGKKCPPRLGQPERISLQSREKKTADSGHQLNISPPEKKLPARAPPFLQVGAVPGARPGGLRLFLTIGSARMEKGMGPIDARDLLLRRLRLTKKAERFSEVEKRRLPRGTKRIPSGKSSASGNGA